MAIINRCPLTGIVNRCDTTSLHVQTNYLNSILGLSVSKLVELSNASNLPNLDYPTDTKLVFCAFAKQSNLLIHHRQLLSVSDKIVFTHFNLLKSIAIYLQKEPNFAKRLPKYAHYTGVSMNNFGHYLELLKKEKELYIEERKQLKQHYKEQEQALLTLDELDVANTKLGMMASKYATKLKLTETTSNGYAMPKQLSQYILVAMQVNKDLHEFFTYLMTSPVSKLYNDTEVKEIDLVDLIESIEDWETNLNIKYAILDFLRKKLTNYSNYTGRKKTKFDLDELDFLLGDIEVVEKKDTTTVTNSSGTNSSGTTDTTTNSTSTNIMSLAESILAKIAAKKKGQ